jgi:hypothetical protein
MSNWTDFLKKVKDQNFGPNDSQIVSSLVHPARGLGKFGEFLQQNIQAASQAPVQGGNQLMRDNAAIGANNLVGLMQTGAMPFAPKSAGGTIGSVRRPMDAVMTRDLQTLRTPKTEQVKSIWDKYFTRDWATDIDPLVKHVDSGGNISGIPQQYGNTHITGMVPSKKWVNNLLDTVSNGTFTPTKGKTITPYNTGIGHVQDVLDNIRNPNELSVRGMHNYKTHANRIQNIADELRKIQGTNQVAKTEAGKYFENVNDISAMSSSYINPKIDSRVSQNRLPSESQFRPTEVSDEFANNQYLKNNPSALLFQAPYHNPTYMSERLPGTVNRMSLVDTVMHANAADAKKMAADIAERTSKETLYNLSTAEPLHAFDDGLVWKKVTNSAAGRTEGMLQNNCLKEAPQYNKIDAGTTEIYSLRDTNNNPLVTGQWDPVENKWIQFKERFNKKPRAEFAPHIKALKDLLKP